MNDSRDHSPITISVAMCMQLLLHWTTLAVAVSLVIVSCMKMKKIQSLKGVIDGLRHSTNNQTVRTEASDIVETLHTNNFQCCRVRHSGLVFQCACFWCAALCRISLANRSRASACKESLYMVTVPEPHTFLGRKPVQGPSLGWRRPICVEGEVRSRFASAAVICQTATDCLRKTTVVHAIWYC